MHQTSHIFIKTANELPILLLLNPFPAILYMYQYGYHNTTMNTPSFIQLKHLRIREFTKDDILSVSCIDADTSEHPWAQSLFDQEILSDTFFGLVINALKDGVLGFVLCKIVVDECEILKIAVMKNCQNRGVGTKLCCHLISYLREHSVKKLFLGVAISNDVALKLYEKIGFKTLNIRKNYYNNKEDAKVMVLVL